MFLSASVRVTVALTRDTLVPDVAWDGEIGKSVRSKLNDPTVPPIVTVLLAVVPSKLSLTVNTN